MDYLEELKFNVCHLFSRFCTLNYVKVLEDKMDKNEYLKLINSKIPNTFINLHIVTKDEILESITYAEQVYAYFELCDKIEEEIINRYDLDEDWALDDFDNFDPDIQHVIIELEDQIIYYNDIAVDNLKKLNEKSTEKDNLK